MLSVQNDTYRTGSGGVISAGVSVQSGIWNPPREAGNVIPLEAYAALGKGKQKNKWALVANSIPNRVLQRALSLYGVDLTTWQYGTDKSASAIYAPWSSPIVDYVNFKMYWYASGGHANSSWNLTAVLDLRTMTWDIFTMPSNPNAPGFVWSSQYKSASTFSSYLPNPVAGSIEAQYGRYSILPDGRPISMHTYGDGLYDPLTKKIIRTIGRRWDFNTETGVEQMFYYRRNGAYFPTYVNSYSFLDQVNRRIWGHLPASDVDYTAWHYMDADAPATGNEIELKNVLTWVQKTSNASCLMDSTRILHIGPWGGGLGACIFNMAEADTAIRAGKTGTDIRDAATHSLATGPGGSALVTGGTLDQSDFPSVAYVDDWNQAIIINTLDALTNGPKWQLLDVGTQKASVWTPEGNAPVLESGATYGGNLHYIPGLKLLVLIKMQTPLLPSVYVMGVGPK